MEKYRLVARRLFSDWQMPDFLPEVYLDVEHFVGKIVEMGGKSIDFCAKNAFGNALYPSEVGYSNPAVGGDGDIFGKLCNLAHENGIEVFAYYNMVLDDKMGEEQPGWYQRGRDGQPLKFEHYAMMCMNSPFRDRVFDQMCELTRLYPFDGFNLDLQYFHQQGCFCDYCKEKFEAMFGYKLDPDAMQKMSDWVDLHSFQRDTRRDFIWESMDKTLQIRPDLLWYWNRSGRFSDDQETDSRATILATEVHPPDYRGTIAKAKWIQSREKPIMFYMPESIGSWGHWSRTTLGTLRGMCAMALAHGGAVSCNHVAPPCGDYRGRVFDAVYELLSTTLAWIGEREDLCLAKKTVPVTAILHSAENTALEDAFRLAITNGAAVGSNKAVGPMNSFIAAPLMVESHIPVDFISSEGEAERMPEYEAILLPNVGYMQEDFAQKIRDYVYAGGNIIATYNTSLLDRCGDELPNFLLADVFGADFNKYSDYSVAYVDSFEEPFGCNIPDMPLLMKDVGYQLNSSYKPIYCTLREGARAVAYFTEPIIESDWAKGLHIYHDHAPPGKRTQWPAIVINRYGKGTCALLPFAFLQAYGFQPNPWYRQLLINILRYMGVPNKFSYEASPSVLLNLTQDEDGWLVHLIKIMKETNSMFLDEVSPSGPVSMNAGPDWPVSAVFNALTGEPVEFRQKDGRVEFAVSGVKEYDIYRIAKAK